MHVLVHLINGERQVRPHEHEILQFSNKAMICIGSLSALPLVNQSCLPDVVGIEIGLQSTMLNQ